jgi:sugar-specific transcriptional regulator TrmB
VSYLRKEPELVEHLKLLGLSEQEARIYIYLVENGSVAEQKILSDLKIDDHKTIDSLMNKGVLIRSPSDTSRLIALHPRNAAANLYKTIENKMIEELRAKRHIADRLGMVLEPAFEASQNNR